MKESYDNHLLSFIWLLFLILPNNQLFFLFVPTAYILLFKYKTKVQLNVTPFVMVFLLLLFLSILFNIHAPWYNTKSVMRTIILMLLFITFGRLRGNKILKPYIYVALGYLVVSQFAYILNLSAISSFFFIHYADSEGIDLGGHYFSGSTTIDGLGSNYRLGGIFSNPNEYARFLGLIMVVLLCEFKQFTKKMRVILFAVIIFSTAATGSRTSFLLLVIVIVYYFYFVERLSVKKIVLWSFILSIIMISGNIIFNFSDLRLLKVREGIDDSLGTKISILKDYLSSNISIIKLLFGNLSSESIKSYTNITFTGTDFDIGDIVLSYGFLFLILLLAFYFTLYQRFLLKYRVIFLVLLWMFSSGVLLNYRMSALFLMILGLYYCRSLKEKNISTIKS